MKTVLQPPGWPRPKGYANGVAARGQMVFVAGMIGWDAEGRFRSDRLCDQARQALININAVLAEHDKELMAVNGVVGVYVGLLGDGQTPCLKVMLARQTPEALRAIPKKLEGYPVVIEVTGEIRPFEKP